MNFLQYSIEDIFLKYLPQQDHNIEIRKEQIELAKNINYILTHNGTYIVEAGTGIGKSFSYIIPAIKKALSNQPVVIVTGTIALQHQLADKDIPRIQKLLGTNIPVTVLKGKTNYLCQTRLNHLIFGEQGTLFSTEGLEEDTLDSIVSWSNTTQTGDKEELNTCVPISNEIWKKISTHEYSCGGRKCQNGGQGCFYIKARRTAKQAGIIITNYSLLSFHLQSIAEPEGEGLLPENAIFILDEAHNLMNIVRQSFTSGISSYDLQQVHASLFGQTGTFTLEQHLRGSFESSVQKQINNIEKKFKEISARIEKINPLIFQARKEIQYFQNSEEISYELFFDTEVFRAHHFQEEFRLLHIDFKSISDAFDMVLDFFSENEDFSLELEKYQQWSDNLSEIAQLFAQTKKPENLVRWFKLNPKTEKDVSYLSGPLFIDQFLSTNLFERYPQIICTSATLAFNKKFDHWIQVNGAFSASHADIFPSPFPYKKQVLLAIPSDAPIVNQNEDSYIEYLISHLPACLDISEGRALILCTSKKMVLHLSQALEQRAKSSKWNILTQDGSMGISTLAEKFRKNEHSVLIGTNSFWEGFDAPGDTLKMLVITRIPFPSPVNLFVHEESKYIDATEGGGTSFGRVSLPMAELRLRQGFGRLMRSHQDGGVIFITDNRLFSKSYGKQLLQSLPECTMRSADTKTLMKEIKSHLESL